jgi:hypothetical protein
VAGAGLLRRPGAFFGDLNLRVFHPSAIATIRSLVRERLMKVTPNRVVSADPSRVLSAAPELCD